MEVAISKSSLQEKKYVNKVPSTNAAWCQPVKISCTRSQILRMGFDIYHCRCACLQSHAHSLTQYVRHMPLTKYNVTTYATFLQLSCKSPHNSQHCSYLHASFHVLDATVGFFYEMKGFSTSYVSYVSDSYVEHGKQ